MLRLLSDSNCYPPPKPVVETLQTSVAVMAFIKGIIMLRPDKCI